MKNYPDKGLLAFFFAKFWPDNKPMSIVSSIITFYADGFRRMTLGKTLWAIILIKLFVLFAIVKVFLLPNHLNSRCDTPGQKSACVADSLAAAAATASPDSTSR